VGHAAGNVSPRLRATLEAIKRIGEPVMESQIVADHTEIDRDGFLCPSASCDSKLLSEATAEIRSLGLRADSRDTRALMMNETSQGQDKYMLQLESRELRRQARKLTNGRIDAAADNAASAVDAAAFPAGIAVSSTG
jgi:hypothetical protein